MAMTWPIGKRLRLHPASPTHRILGKRRIYQVFNVGRHGGGCSNFDSQFKPAEYKLHAPKQSPEASGRASLAIASDLQDGVVPHKLMEAVSLLILLTSVIMAVSEHTGIAASRIYGVTTFYEQFRLEPHGRHTVKCCRGTACYIKGGRDIVKRAY